MLIDRFVVFRRCCAVALVGAVLALVLTKPGESFTWSLWFVGIVPAAFAMDALVVLAIYVFNSWPGTQQMVRRVEAISTAKAPAPRRVWFGASVILGLVSGVVLGVALVATFDFVGESIAKARCLYKSGYWSTPSKVCRRSPR